MSGHDAYAANAGYDLRNPDAPEVVVLLHGLGADRTQPAALIADAPAARGHAVLSADARAHGDTETIGAPEDFTLPALVADLSALLRRLGQGGKPVHLIGISMGAAIALRAALDRALDVRSLALVRPAFSATPLPDNLRVMADIGDLLRLPDLSAARSRFLGSAAYRDVARVSALGAASLLAQFDAPFAVRRSIRLRAVPRNAAYRHTGELAAISARTTVVGTPDDPVHPLELARTWAAGIPGAVLATIPPRDRDLAESAAQTRRVIAAHLDAVHAASWT